MISRPDLWSSSDVAGFHRGSAPELMRPHRRGKPAAQITKASDIYAFGMLTWQVGITFHRNLRSRLAHDKPHHISDLFGKRSVLWGS